METTEEGKLNNVEHLTLMDFLQNLTEKYVLFSLVLSHLQGNRIKLETDQSGKKCSVLEKLSHCNFAKTTDTKQV